MDLEQNKNEVCKFKFLGSICGVDDHSNDIQPTPLKIQQVVSLKAISAKMFSIYKDEQEVISQLQNLIEKIANDSIEARGTFFVGFSGENFDFQLLT